MDRREKLEIVPPDKQIQKTQKSACAALLWKKACERLSIHTGRGDICRNAE